MNIQLEAWLSDISRQQEDPLHAPQRNISSSTQPSADPCKWFDTDSPYVVKHTSIKPASTFGSDSSQDGLSIHSRSPTPEPQDPPPRWRCAQALEERMMQEIDSWSPNDLSEAQFLPVSKAAIIYVPKNTSRTPTPDPKLVESRISDRLINSTQVPSFQGVPFDPTPIARSTRRHEIKALESTQMLGTGWSPRTDSLASTNQYDTYTSTTHTKSTKFAGIEGQGFRNIKRVHSDGRLSFTSHRSGMPTLNKLSFLHSPTPPASSQTTCPNHVNESAALNVPEAKSRRILRNFLSRCKSLRGTRVWNRLPNLTQTYRCSTPTSYPCHPEVSSTVRCSGDVVAAPFSVRVKNDLSRSDSGASARRNCQLV